MTDKFTQITDVDDGYSIDPIISGDGKTIAFQSYENLTGDNADSIGGSFAFQEGVGIKQITKASVTFSDSIPIDINYDGTRITFESSDDPIGFNPDLNGEVFLAILPKAAETAVTIDGQGNLIITDPERFDNQLKISFDILSDEIIISDTVNKIKSPAGGTQINDHKISIPVALVTGGNVAVNSGLGSDLLTVDSSVAFSTLNIQYDGGEQEGPAGDTLSVIGPADKLDLIFNDSNSGSVEFWKALNASTVSYIRLEPITSTITAADISLSYSSDSEVITISDGGNQQTTVDSTYGEIFTFNNPTNSLSINSGGGGDLVEVQGLGATFDADLTIQADDIDLTGAINTGAGALTLLRHKAGEPITLGTEITPVPTFGFAAGFTGTNSSDSEGHGIVVDDQGTVYTTGYFEQTYDFDPGPGVFNLTSDLIQDLYIMSLDHNGDFRWANRIGGTDEDAGVGIAVDKNDNVFVAGSFGATADFDSGPGETTLDESSGGGIFVTSLTSQGSFRWAKNFGDSSSFVAYDLAVDQMGNVYTTGSFSETVDFDPGAQEYNLTSSANGDVFCFGSR
ncbi:MAG: hypothetical protein ACKVH8_22445 [Pirellulales bacterium]